MSAQNQRHKSGILLRVILAIVIVSMFAYLGNFNLFIVEAASPQAISASDNSALWGKANTALANFLSEGLKIFSRSSDQPATEQELASLSRYINDFSSAVKTLAEVVPPSEQAIMHKALLPIYQEIPGHMTGIRDAMLSNDPWKLDLEWHNLALLLDESSETLKILTLKPASAMPSPTPATGQPATRENGSLVVGKFEVMRRGSGFTPAGFIFAFTAIAAIFFLAVGQVFAYRLRRLSKRK